MSACPLQSVLADFEAACKSLDDKDAIREIMMLADSLRLGGAILGNFFPKLYSSKYKVIIRYLALCIFILLFARLLHV